MCFWLADHNNSLTSLKGRYDQLLTCTNKKIKLKWELIFQLPSLLYQNNRSSWASAKSYWKTFFWYLICPSLLHRISFWEADNYLYRASTCHYKTHQVTLISTCIVFGSTHKCMLKLKKESSPWQVIAIFSQAN